MDPKEAILKENLDEYAELGEVAIKSKKYNSAVTLFFKAICAAADIFILRKEKEVPSSHTERFRICREKHPPLYEILDKDFPFYTEGYNKRMDKESAEMIRDDCRKIEAMLK